MLFQPFCTENTVLQKKGLGMANWSKINIFEVLLELFITHKKCQLSLVCKGTNFSVAKLGKYFFKKRKKSKFLDCQYFLLEHAWPSLSNEPTATTFDRLKILQSRSNVKNKFKSNIKLHDDVKNHSNWFKLVT